MIRGSLSMALAAAGVSALAHGAGLVMSWGAPPPPQIAGSGQGAVALLGESFRDVAMGTLLPETVAEPLEAVEPEALRPVQPQALVPLAEVAKASPAPVAQVAKPLTPLAPVTPLAPAQASPPAPAAPVLAALPDQNEIAPQLSPRPALRPKTIEETARASKPAARPKPAKPAKTQKTQKKAAKKPPRGNGQTAAKRGGAQGQKQATAGKPGRKKAAGNAAASNYRGIVQRRILRRKPRNSIRGTALVTFSIGRNGALVALSLAKSSGSPKLDQLALTAVRRAAPFPPPPPGAPTRFRLPIKGR